MRKSFPGYYRPTKEEFSDLWRTCLFVLDTNVLLNLYRYSLETREALLDILDKIADRLWIPHQVGFEYQEQRLGVIAQQKKAYGEVRKEIEKARKGLESRLNAFRKHPFINPNEILDPIETQIPPIMQKLEDLEKQHPDLIGGDSIRDTLTLLFDGKVGPPYSTERLSKIRQEGQSRYEAKIPPGYEDKGKDDEKRYGDLILWYQMIDKAAETKQPIIFISDDRKEDWWWKFEEKSIGPRPELVQEMLSKAGVPFYMYPPERFMEYAKDYLEQEISQDAIDEVREVGEEYEGVEAAPSAAMLDPILWLGLQDEEQRAMMSERLREVTGADLMFEEFNRQRLQQEAREAAVFEQFYRQRLREMAMAAKMLEKLYPPNYLAGSMASEMSAQLIRSRLEDEGRTPPGAPTSQKEQPTTECDDNETAQDRKESPDSELQDKEHDREENGEDE